MLKERINERLKSRKSIKAPSKQKTKEPERDIPHILKVISGSLRVALVELYDEYFSHKVLDGVTHLYIETKDIRGVKLIDKVKMLSDEANVLSSGFDSIFSSIQLNDGVLYDMDIRFVESLHRYKLGMTKPSTLVADLKELYKKQGIELVDYLKGVAPTKGLPVPIIINAELLPNSKVEVYRSSEVVEYITVEAFSLNLKSLLEVIKQAKLKLEVQMLGYTKGQGLLITLEEKQD
jgi:hypothetical protein